MPPSVTAADSVPYVQEGTPSGSFLQVARLRLSRNTAFSGRSRKDQGRIKAI